MNWSRQRTILIILMILYLVFIILGVVLWMNADKEEVQVVEQKTEQNTVVDALQSEGIKLVDELIEASE